MTRKRQWNKTIEFCLYLKDNPWCKSSAPGCISHFNLRRINESRLMYTLGVALSAISWASNMRRYSGANGLGLEIDNGVRKKGGGPKARTRLSSSDLIWRCRVACLIKDRYLPILLHSLCLEPRATLPPSRLLNSAISEIWPGWSCRAIWSDQTLLLLPFVRSFVHSFARARELVHPVDN